MNKTAEIAEKWLTEYVGSPQADMPETRKTFEGMVNEALEWAAQQCELARDEQSVQPEFHSQNCHNTDALMIRKGKSK